MTVSQIYKAWILLLALSLTTTSLTLAPASTLTCAVILLLAGMKARVILAQYLELGHSAFWMRFFTSVIALFLLVAFTLYAVAPKVAS